MNTKLIIELIPWFIIGLVVGGSVGWLILSLFNLFS